MKRIPAVLSLAFLFGCEAGQPAMEGFVGTTDFARFTCDWGVSPDAAVASIGRITGYGELTVGTQEIAAGATGTVVEVIRGDLAQNGTYAFMVYEEGAEKVYVFARKASAPSNDDNEFVTILLDAVPLEGCEPATANFG